MLSPYTIYTYSNVPLIPKIRNPLVYTLLSPSKVLEKVLINSHTPHHFSQFPCVDFLVHNNFV